MSNISTWSTTADDNDMTPPDGFPEGQAPNTVNDSSRECMAALRRWFEDPDWIDLGHTPTYVDATSFTVTGDQTGIYKPGRRLRLDDASTLYGFVTSSSYSSNTTVNVVIDSGSLSASLTAVSLGILDPARLALPKTMPFTRFITETGTATLDLANWGDVIDCTSGTFTITLTAANVAASYPVPFIVTIINSGSGTITIARAGSDTIDGGTSITLDQYESVTLIADGTSAWRQIMGFGL